MSAFGKLSPTARRSALALMMLAVLLAGTAAAWWVSQSRVAPRPGEVWYLATGGDGGTVIGWEVRRDVESGTARQGYEVRIVYPKPQFILWTWSQWKLDPAAAQGQYASAVWGGRMDQEGSAMPILTRIKYSHQTVEVQHSSLDSGRISAAGGFCADPGYLAEGSLWPTVVEVARKQEPFAGTMILDEHAVMADIALRPLSPETCPVGGQDMSLTPVVESIGQIPVERRDYVAADGSVPVFEEIAGDQTETYTRVSLADVLKQFPHVLADRARYVNQYKLP